MNVRILVFGIIALVATGAAVQAQSVEADDMYFTSKDRAKLVAAQANNLSINNLTPKEEAAEETTNPTDSYSARNVNPEFTSRSNSKTAKADDEDYFVNNYRYNTLNNYSSWNNGFNNWYNNPWYTGSYWGSSMNMWNNPYSSFYDPFGGPWADPYFGSGWSSSFGFWGNSWNNGWGMNYGMMYPMNPWNSWATWGPGFGFSYWNSPFFRPTRVIIVDNGNAPVYGKRQSRSSQFARDDNNGYTRNYTRGSSAGNGDSGRGYTGGRSANASSQQQADYYNRSQRNQAYYNNNNSGYSNTNNSNSRSSWESNTRSSWRESSGGGFNNSSNSGGRSYSSGSSGGGGSTGGGGGSSSRSSRGRN